MNYTCGKCNKSMDEKNFYQYKDGTKTEFCKKCFTMHIDNFNPETFLWALEKMDVPYIEEEWNVLRDRAYAKNPKTFNGTSVFGKYLSKMKLKQWKDYTWADTEKFRQEKEERDKARKEEIEEMRRLQSEMKEKYEAGEISEAEYRTYILPEQQVEDDRQAFAAGYGQAQIGSGNMYGAADMVKEDFLDDPSQDLTEEDKKYLAMKWGIYYRPREWVELERKYVEMEESFDIQDADTKSTLVLLCKTNLKMNQAIDSGDLDGYNKLSRTYDALRKSAKFTAAQNKENKGDFVDCVRELVAYCEKVGGKIPKYEIKTDYDIVDTVIKDLKDYNLSLIKGDTALAQQIEDYLKNRAIADEKLRQKKLAKLEGKVYQEEELNDEDIQDFSDNISIQKEEDNKLYYGLEDNEE